jgi:hypothetical protein
VISCIYPERIDLRGINERFRDLDDDTATKELSTLVGRSHCADPKRERVSRVVVNVSKTERRPGMKMCFDRRRSSLEKREVSLPCMKAA